MSEYILPELPEGFNEPPAYPSSPRPRPGGASTGTSQWGGSWGPSISPAPTSQGGGAIMGGGVGGGPVLDGQESISWLPSHRGFIGGKGVRGGNY